MIVVTKYDELRDKGVTVGGMAFDLQSAIENDVIQSFQSNLDYNGIESVGEIEGRVTDVFRALELAKQKAISMAKFGSQPAPSSGGEPASVAGTSVTSKGDEE